MEEDDFNETPISNEDIFHFLVRVHRLVLKVRSLVSMIRSISSFQRYVEERLNSNQGGFILDVKVNIYLRDLFLL